LFRHTGRFGKKRIVDLPRFLVDELRVYITKLKRESLEQGNGGEVDLLFLDPKEQGGWPYSQRKIQALVKRVCKGTGMRHCCAQQKTDDSCVGSCGLFASGLLFISDRCEIA